MRITFEYNEDKDLWCLLNKGGGSLNSPGKMTKTYTELLEFAAGGDVAEVAGEFIHQYISEHNIDTKRNAKMEQENWNGVSEQFEKIAERVFGVNIEDTITAYLTITGRWPYNIGQKYFFVSAKASNNNVTAMHELWHFYTYAAFGKYEKDVGPQKYNEIKESLTVLLNMEAAHIMGGEADEGYPQHKELRSSISKMWVETKDIQNVWGDALDKCL